MSEGSSSCDSVTCACKLIDMFRSQLLVYRALCCASVTSSPRGTRPWSVSGTPPPIPALLLQSQSNARLVAHAGRCGQAKAWGLHKDVDVAEAVEDILR